MNLEPTLSFALAPEFAAKQAAELRARFPLYSVDDLVRGRRFQRQAGSQLRSDSVTALKGSKILPEGVSVIDFAGEIASEFFYNDETYFILQTGDLINWDVDRNESEARLHEALEALKAQSSADDEVKGN